MNTYGGKREGAGRKPAQGRTMKKTFVYLSEEVLNKMAEAHPGTNTSETIRYFVTRQFADSVTPFERTLFTEPRVWYRDINGHDLQIDGDLHPGFMLTNALLIVDDTAELTTCAWIVRVGYDQFLYADSSEKTNVIYRYTIGPGSTRTRHPIAQHPDSYADGTTVYSSD